MTDAVAVAAPAVEMLALDEIHAFDGNSKAHPPDQVAALARSIREFGFTAPVLIDETGTLLAGHGRVMAAREVGLLSVPAIRVTHLTPDQKRAYVIADNRLTELGGWDEKALAAQIQMLMDAGVDVSVTGFDDKESKRLLAALTATSGKTDPDTVPPMQKKAVSRYGDVWTLGRHRVMCGDSTATGDMQQLTAGVLVDMWLTDPPYNVDMTAKNRMLAKAGKARKDQQSFGIQNDAMGDASFRKFLTSSYMAADSVMRPGAVFYVWHADSEGFNFRGAAFDAGWKVRQCLIWSKSVLAIGRNDYQWKHEPCLYGWKDGAAHLWASDRKQTTVLQFDKPAKSTEHPTMKPVALFEYQMLNNTNAGDLVLDSFGGSGTTLIAAEKNGRDARLMELDPRYCDVIVRRWQEFTGLKAVHAGDGVEFDEIAALR